MKTYKLQIRVRYKEGILDPQAEAISSALKKLEFKSVGRVECDKVYLIELSAENEGQAIQQGRQMANQLLANIVMENFDVEVVE